MNSKIKIISAVLSVLSVMSLCACGKASTAETTTTTGVWQTTPEVVEFSTEPETTYASCDEPFYENYYKESSNTEDGRGTVTGAYVDKNGNPLSVESYTDENGYICFSVCKFRDGKVYRLTMETDSKEFTPNNNLLIDKDSDMLVLRYYIDETTIRQTIYDFDDDEYIAVRDKNFGYDDTESMQAAVTDYKAAAKNLVSFSDVAVTENIEAYIEKNLSTQS